MENQKYNSITDYLKSDEYKQYLEETEKAIKLYELESTNFFNKLSYNDKLLAFYYIVSHIYQGEIIDKGSYRHILYSVFGFNQDAYALAIDAGYMDLHNSIYSREELEESVENIIKFLNLEYSTKLKNNILEIIIHGFIPNKNIINNQQLKLDFEQG